MRCTRDAVTFCWEFRCAWKETQAYTMAPKIKKFAVEFLLAGFSIVYTIEGLLDDVESLFHIAIAKVLAGSH